MDSKIIITPQGTLIGQAVVWGRFLANPLIRLLLGLIWLAGLISIISILRKVYEIAPVILDEQLTDELGVYDTAIPAQYYLGLGIFMLYLPWRLFYREKLRYPRLAKLDQVKSDLESGKSINLFNYFSYELARSTSPLFGHKGLPLSIDLLKSVLKSPDMNFILVRLGVAKADLIRLIPKDAPRSDVLVALKQALDNAILEAHHQIEVGDLFTALCQTEPFCQAVLKELKLEVEDIANVVYWQTSLIRRRLFGRRFLDPRRFRFNGGIGRDWAYGYTPILRQFGRDLTEAIRNQGLDLEIVGRKKETGEIVEALLRQEGGNVVLVGEAGIGKRTTVLGLAKKMVEGEIDDRLAFSKIIQVDVEALLSGYSGLGDAGGRLTQLFDEAVGAGNVILFFPHIEYLLSDEGAGRINAADILIPQLESNQLHIIGTTDIANYNSLIRPHSVLGQQLTRVTVNESDDLQTIKILEDSIPLIEGRTGSLVSYEAIKETVIAAEKFILDIPNPNKSINLLDGAAAHATAERGKTVVLPKDIHSYLTLKYDLPASETGVEERAKLLNLEVEMHKSVIGQNEAIKAIAGAMKRARAGVTDSKKPIGSFLFLGPTGVGKTETAKALARSYFGDEMRMIRFDMSEYQNPGDIYRFIGSNLGGESEQGVLTTAVREHPFSLLLFDEIEKADRNILDLFLQILDEGHVTDGSGRKVSFTNTIIICTSNAGANLIRESIKSGEDYANVKNLLLDQLQQEGIYRPEFLNRFTQVVAFSPLSAEEISEVATMMVEELKKTLEKNKQIQVEVSPEAIAKLAKLGFDPQMGARPMARVISEKIENLLAQQILEQKLNSGDQITITGEMV